MGGSTSGFHAVGFASVKRAYLSGLEELPWMMSFSTCPGGNCSTEPHNYRRLATHRRPIIFSQLDKHILQVASGLECEQ